MLTRPATAARDNVDTALERRAALDSSRMARPRTSMRPRARLAGFTLIELLIVIIIIGILMAIGIPAYLKYVAAANDRDAQAALRTAYKAAIAGDTEVNASRFPVASTIVQDVQADEPGISIARGSCPAGIGAASTKQVLVDPSSTASQVTMCTSSASGAIWKLSGPLTGNPTVSDASTVTLTFSGNEMTNTIRAAAVQGDGQPADSSTGVWESTTNLVPNGGFEGAAVTSGWTSLGGGAVLTQDTGTSKFGAASMKVVVASGFDGVRRIISVSASTTYTFSVWVKGPASNLQVKLDDNGAGASQITTVSPGGGGWTRYSATITTAAGATTANLYVIGTGPWTAWIDGAQLEQKAFPTPYVETNGATASRGAGFVRLPTSLVSPAQGWAAIRMRWQFPSSALGSFISPPRIFGWFQTGNDRLDLRFPNFGGQTAPTFIYCAAGNCTGPNDPTNFSFVPGDLYTFVVYWTPSTLGVSVNGGSFYTTPNTVGTPAFTSALPETGSYNGGTQIDSDILWFAYGTGTLTNADSATVNGFGNNDPKRSSFPASTQATMVWDGTSATGSLK